MTLNSTHLPLPPPLGAMFPRNCAARTPSFPPRSPAHSIPPALPPPYRMPTHASRLPSFIPCNLFSLPTRQPLSPKHTPLTLPRNCPLRRRHLRCEQSNEPLTEPTPSPSPPPVSPPLYRIQLLSSVTDLSQSLWDRFASAACASPFLRHHWLRCLEHSGCASARTGWIPRHIVLRDDAGDVVALAPAYVKHHSLGEFVFDQDWAEAAYGAGIMYYPKLLLAVPFTPATGRRILTVGEGREELLDVFGSVLVRVCEALGASSVHVNFCAEDEVRALRRAGFLERKGVQYHFTNYRKGKEDDTARDGPDAERVPYRDFEDYLADFKSKRRIKMRRERKVVREESGLNIQVLRGAEINKELMENMFHIYKSTIDKLFFGRQYLTLGFFQMLAECEEFREQICLVLARRKDNSQIVGGTLNVVGEKDGGVFYGRYWGCVEEYRYLHFETCYYAAIEYCIEQGLSRMEPGAGGGDFKFLRGYEPCVTYSMHFLRDARLAEAVARFLRMESLHIEGAVGEMNEHSAIRSKERNKRKLL